MVRFPSRSRRTAGRRRSTCIITRDDGEVVARFAFSTGIPWFFVAVFALQIAALTHFFNHDVGRSDLVPEKRQIAAGVQFQLDDLYRVIQPLSQDERNVHAALDDLQALVARNRPGEVLPVGVHDEQTLFSIPEDRLAYELDHTREVVENARRTFEDIRAAYSVQARFLDEIPNGWPLGRGLGTVTMEFGPNRHPIYGEWYLHKGLDIASFPGAPIVASASGTVVEAGFDLDYGNYVLVRHGYGFRSKYSHLQDITVSVGDRVEKGQLVGTMGSSGLATGTVLDFIIEIGGQVVDPAVFLSISNDFRRGGYGTR